MKVAGTINNRKFLNETPVSKQNIEESIPNNTIMYVTTILKKCLTIGICYVIVGTKIMLFFENP